MGAASYARRTIVTAHCTRQPRLRKTIQPGILHWLSIFYKTMTGLRRVISSRRAPCCYFEKLNTTPQALNYSILLSESSKSAPIRDRKKPGPCPVMASNQLPSTVTHSDTGKRSSKRLPSFFNLAQKKSVPPPPTLVEDFYPKYHLEWSTLKGWLERTFPNLTHENEASLLNVANSLIMFS